MFCRNCGNQVPNGSTYCAGCGSSLRMAPAVGLSNPGAGGYSYQGAGGYNNPTAGGYGNPAAGGYGNPAAGGYGNPGAGGYSNSNAYGNNYAPNSGYANQGLSVDPDIALRTLTSKLRTSANLWTAIGIYQIFMGIILLIFGYGVLSLILGIWNIVQSSKARKNAAYFQSNPVDYTIPYATNYPRGHFPANKLPQRSFFHRCGQTTPEVAFPGFTSSPSTNVWQIALLQQ